MIRNGRGLVVLVVAAVAVLALTVGRASGGPLSGVSSQLESTPDLSGAVPDVPSAPSVPDVSGAVPDVSGAVPEVTHAVPDTSSAPSVPSSRLPSAIRDAVPSAGSGVPGNGRGAHSPTQDPSRAASSLGPSRGSSPARGPQSRAELRAAAEHRARARAAHERHLRRDVQRLSGCLDALP